MVTLRWTQNTVVADETHLLPLSSIALPDAVTTHDPSQTTTTATGFGEMIDFAVLHCSALSVQPKRVPVDWTRWERPGVPFSLERFISLQLPFDMMRRSKASATTKRLLSAL
jgi:hypothetical protein